jgi:hypothetical protein
LTAGFEPALTVDVFTSVPLLQRISFLSLQLMLSRGTGIPTSPSCQ